MGLSAPNYIWRKLATPEWLRDHNAALSELTSGEFAIIEIPGRTRLAIENYCRNEKAARNLVRAFGGKRGRLPRNWFDKFLQLKATKPMRVGTRLVVTNTKIEGRPNILHIPAGAAFGTGEHATTAMSLRLLEQATRRLSKDWRMLDAGTGSGILALAGKRFGAGDVVAIDNDPLAIKTAKQNARANQIRGVKFVVGDVIKSLSGHYDIIMANLFSELLVTVLPKFRRSLAADGHLILSGVLRSQEPRLRRALRSANFKILLIRHRGKWIALLAACGQKQS